MRTKQTRRRKDAGTCAKHLSRRGVRRARPLWAVPLRNLRRALAASRRMVDATWSDFERASDRAERCPVRTARELRRLTVRLLDATNRLGRAVSGLGETTDSLLLEPKPLPDAPRVLTEAVAEWVLTAVALEDTSRQICILHAELVKQLLSGELTPEKEGPRRRPRINPVPRLIFARDFLLCRRKRAHDRIATIPMRRRRAVCRPAEDAPRRISRGRAPPPFSTCLL